MASYKTQIETIADTYNFKNSKGSFTTGPLSVETTPNSAKIVYDSHFSPKGLEFEDVHHAYVELKYNLHGENLTVSIRNSNADEFFYSISSKNELPETSNGAKVKIAECLDDLVEMPDHLADVLRSHFK